MQPRSAGEANRSGELEHRPVRFADRTGDRPARIQIVVDRIFRLVRAPAVTAKVVGTRAFKLRGEFERVRLRRLYGTNLLCGNSRWRGTRLWCGTGILPVSCRSGFQLVRLAGSQSHS